MTGIIFHKIGFNGDLSTAVAPLAGLDRIVDAQSPKRHNSSLLHSTALFSKERPHAARKLHKFPRFVVRVSFALLVVRSSKRQELLGLEVTTHI